MLTENRKYNYIAELNLHKSRVLDELSQPKDDKVNWLFLCINDKQYNFIYKIENPVEAKYNEPFNVHISFMMIDYLKDFIELNFVYAVMRGQEEIGTIKIITKVE